MRILIDENTTQNDTSTIPLDLNSKSQRSEGGEGRKEGREEKEGRKNAKTETKVTLN